MILSDLKNRMKLYTFIICWKHFFTLKCTYSYRKHRNFCSHNTSQVKLLRGKIFIGKSSPPYNANSLCVQLFMHVACPQKLVPNENSCVYGLVNSWNYANFSSAQLNLYSIHIPSLGTNVMHFMLSITPAPIANTFLLFVNNLLLSHRPFPL